MTTPDGETSPVVTEPLQVRLEAAIAGSPFQLGVIVEKHYSNPRMGDDRIRRLMERGIQPVSSTLINVYPGEPCATWDAYTDLCVHVAALAAPFAEESSAFADGPEILYDKDGETEPDLRLGTFDFLEHPLPTFITLTTLVVHASHDLATRFAAQAEDTDILDAVEYNVAAHELPFELPPAPEPEVDTEQPSAKKGAPRRLAARLGAWLLRFSDS